MKYILSSLFGINILLSVSASISGTIWVHNNGNYITTSQFAFYLCVSFISTIVGIIYLCIKHTDTFTIFNYSEVINNIACLCSFIITLLWVAASICIALLTKDCLNIKFNEKDICSGATANIVLGISLLFVWLSILWISLKRLLRLYRRTPALEAQASHEISNRY